VLAHPFVLALQERRPVGRPRSSDRYIRKELLLTLQELAALEAIAVKNNLVVMQGKYKGQPNINAAVIWLINNFKKS
jgi:hypothetical protein